jgi:hypothetical protein
MTPHKLYHTFDTLSITFTQGYTAEVSVSWIASQTSEALGDFGSLRPTVLR